MTKELLITDQREEIRQSRIAFWESIYRQLPELVPSTRAMNANRALEAWDEKFLPVPVVRARKAKKYNEG